MGRHFSAGVAVRCLPAHHPTCAARIDAHDPDLFEAALTAATASMPKPLRDQVRECLQDWAKECKEEAQQGNVESMMVYAFMALKGLGVGPSVAIALRWLDEAAARDFPEAKARAAELRAKHHIAPGSLT